MKNAFLILTLASAACACQPHANHSGTTAKANAEATLSGSGGEAIKRPDSLAARKTKPAQIAGLSPDVDPPIPVRFGKVLRADIWSQPVRDSAEISRFFAAHHLASLLQTVTGQSYDRAMNGFRGANRYRTETVITAARRNLHNPAAYQLQGLTRTRQRIQRFRGEIVFDSLSVEPMLTARDKKDIDEWTMLKPIRLDNDFAVKRYAVAGNVRLAEDKKAPQGAAFEGRFVMELELTSKGQLGLDAPFLHGPSQGGAQKYAGAWTTYQTHQVIPTVWVEDIVGYSPFIYTDLVIGGRDVDINPKYARQGWNTIWQNDEWWAKSPKPKLNL
ncbi:MAG: hypothetical protein JWP58_2947 [Hymenobacter sp.]|nr:hypothetical protein [Hymenobacter sp.]